MVDIPDPLAGATSAVVVPDPLAGWQPIPTSSSNVQPPPSDTRVMSRSYHADGTSDGWGTGNVAMVRGAFGEGYQSVPESVTRPGERSIFTPEAQRGWANSWYGPALNLVGDTVGTALGGIAGIGNSALTLGRVPGVMVVEGACSGMFST